MNHRDARSVDGIKVSEPKPLPADSAHRVSRRQHLLLTVLGTKPKAVRYALEGREVEAPLAALALLKLLPENDRPGRVLALCTPEAEQDSLPLLESELGNRIPVEALRVPAGDKQEHVNVFLEEVIGGIDSMYPDVELELTVDVTHGFRHFSFLTYVAVLYLVALRGVTVHGAYYGMLSPTGPCPFLDLRPLLELPRWVHALEVLEETGSTLPMARNLGDGRGGQPARRIARDLERISEAYLSALPLEAGWQARNVLDVVEQRRRPLHKLLDKEHRLPLSGKLLERLSEILEPFALNKAVTGAGWKRQVRLDRDELHRQSQIVDGLLERGNLATALRLMREWLVSWAVCQQTPDEDEWLNRCVRKRAEGALFAIRALALDGELHGRLKEEQRELGKFWNDLAEVRNAYAHHGMRSDDLVQGKKVEATRKRVLESWKYTFRSSPAISLSMGESFGRRVLVSPIGRRPGVLFSAVQAVREQRGEPALCLVICSHETRGMIAESLGRAGFTGNCKPLVLDDAFAGGVAEIKRIAKAAREHFIGPAEVFVNVTGGTTLMGLGAEKLAGKARSLACPVYRFGLIDRRPTQQQEVDPYQSGEPFWLDSLEGSDDDRD